MTVYLKPMVGVEAQAHDHEDKNDNDDGVKFNCFHFKRLFDDIIHQTNIIKMNRTINLKGFHICLSKFFKVTHDILF